MKLYIYKTHSVLKMTTPDKVFSKKRQHVETGRHYEKKHYL